MSMRLIISSRSYQPNFLRVFLFGAVFLSLLIILDPLHYLLLSDLGLIYNAGHSGIKPVSLFI